MKKAFFYLFQLVFVLISCSKKDNAIIPIEPPLIRFMTMTPNSSWDYETIDNNTSTTSAYTLTSTSKDSTISSKVYHVYTNSSNSSSEYYNITDINYYSFKELPATSGGGKFEILYLKDAALVGTTWSQPFSTVISSVPVSGIVNSKILELLASKTVSGNTYSNVIHVQTSLTIDGLPASIFTANSIDSYYAPKLGLIENTTSINSSTIGINVNTVTTLKKSNIL
jgi:hypothetical protein